MADQSGLRHGFAGWDRQDASGNIFYVLDFGGVSEKSGVFRHIDVYNGDDVCDA